MFIFIYINLFIIVYYFKYRTIYIDEYHNKKVIEKIGGTKFHIRIALLYQLLRQIILTLIFGLLFGFILYYSTAYITWKYIYYICRLLNTVILPYKPIESIMIILIINVIYILLAEIILP